MKSNHIILDYLLHLTISLLQTLAHVLAKHNQITGYINQIMAESEIE